MTTNVSPGVYSRELDLSLYAETVSQTVLGVVGPFAKGPFTRTLVSNTSRLQELFGNPIDSSVSASAAQAWFAAREYLKRGNQLYIARVEAAANPAENSEMSLQGSSDDSMITGSDGATSVPATRTLTSAGSNFTTAGVIVGDVVEVSGGADAGFYVITNVATTVLTVDRDWPTGSLSSQSFTVWAAKKEAGTDGATGTVSSRTLTSAGSTFVTNGVAVGDLLQIADSGDPEDNGVYSITAVTATTVTVDRDWPTGSLTGLTFTIYGPSSSGSDGSTAVAGQLSSASAQFAAHGVKAGDILRINDTVDTANNGFYLITASTATTVTVGTGTWPGGSLTGLTYEVLPGSIRFTTATKGTWAKGYRIKAIQNANDPLNFNLEIRNVDGSLQLEQVFNLDRSNVVSTLASNSTFLTATVVTSRGEPATGKTFTLAGGDDGYTGLAASDYIGTTGGLKVFKNTEEAPLDILAVPGVTIQSVQDEMIEICQSRGDAVALIDIPDSPTVSTPAEALQFVNGTLSGGRTTSLNNNYAAVYWPWIQVYDEFKDANIWTAPSGHVAAVYANNDNRQAPWFAPAGLKRGNVVGAQQLRYSPDQDERDALYGPGAVVNPIVNFTGQGIYVFGQKTTQRATTALNRVNVRRMAAYLKKTLAPPVRTLVFDPNDAVLEREFIQVADPVLQDVQARRGLNQYRINNATTDTNRSNLEAVFQLFVEPTTAAETIGIVVVITPQGASFDDLIVT